MAKHVDPVVEKDSLGGTVERHPSYGVISVSKRTCGGAGNNVFGSSIRHRNTFTLTISEASKRRDLHHTRQYPEKELVEIEMSPSQFIDMITTQNTGCGVPCTIKYVGREERPPCPETNQREVFEKEFRQDLKDLLGTASGLVKKAEAMFGQKTFKKSEQNELLSILRQIQTEIGSNLEFVNSSFNESMDKTVTEAKAEVEAMFSNTIAAYGLQAMQAKGLLPSIEPEPKRIESQE